jgi:hypothetical protein
MMMTPVERKAAFRNAADLNQKTLSGAAYEVCGVTWEHLGTGIADKRPLSADVKAKFAAYIGRSVEDVFGSERVEPDAKQPAA